MNYNNSDCIYPCPDGTYLDEDEYYCYDCNPICNRCSGPNDNQCSSCKLGTLYNSSCVNTCPETYYISNDKCNICVSPCLTCYSSSDCLSCISKMRYLNNRCYFICPKGYYIDGNNCLPCK